MAASRKQQERVRRARELYVQGMDRDAIAHLLGVSKGAVSLWQNREQKAGVSWDEQREHERARRPEAVLKMLEERLAQMAVNNPPAPDAKESVVKAYEAKLHTMIKVIQGYRDTAGEPALQMRALECFAEFCASELTPEQVAAVREAVERFIEHLRRQCE